MLCSGITHRVSAAVNNPREEEQEEQEEGQPLVLACVITVLSKENTQPAGLWDRQQINCKFRLPHISGFIYFSSVSISIGLILIDSSRLDVT